MHKQVSLKVIIKGMENAERLRIIKEGKDKVTPLTKTPTSPPYNFFRREAS